MNQQVINKEKLEYLKTYITTFTRAYMLATGKKLTTVDQILELIESGEFTFEDMFDVYLDQCFKYGDLSEEAEKFWDYNMEAFNVENYFPDDSKQVGSGSWIKIRTETGYEVHFAKVSNRKRRFIEEYASYQKQITSLYKGLIKGYEDVTKKVDEILTPAKEAKKKYLNAKLRESEIRLAINLKPYEVRINRTKSKVEYLLPYQYEIVNDIQEHVDAYIANTPGVNTKTLFTSLNKDAIFYLQSRGISKKVAEMMSALQQVYFTVDMVVATNAYNEHIKRKVKIVSA